LIQASVDQIAKRTLHLNEIDAFFNKMSGLTTSQIEYKYCPFSQLLISNEADVSFADDVPVDKKFKWSIFEFPLLYSG
jgi:hypothetical protein